MAAGQELALPGQVRPVGGLELGRRGVVGRGDVELEDEPAERLLGRVPVEPLRTPAPEGDHAVRVGGDDRGVNLVQQPGLHAHSVLRRALRGHVEALHHDPGRAVPAVARDAHGVPVRLTPILEFEALTLAVEHRAQLGDDALVLPADEEAVADRRAARGLPDEVRRDDRAEPVDHRDLARQRVERTLEEVAHADHLRFGVALLGDVADHAEDARPGRPEVDRTDIGDRREPLPVGAPQRDVEPARAGEERLAQRGREPLGVLLVPQRIGRRGAQEFVLGEAGHLAQAAVHLDHAEVGADDGDAVLQGVDQRPAAIRRGLSHGNGAQKGCRRR